ncbi:MAG: hypothetical protein ABT20_09930 [Rubrivivax sp. SCN 70-15]|nr:MAG: hypothetical protein ABT20_09930 [Rubrivivax sp. SCN 70-15]
MIVGKGAITVQFFEIGEQVLHVIERVGTLRVARQLGNLPRRELGVDFLGQLRALLLQPLDLFRDIDGGIVLDEAQLFDLGFEVGNGLLEVEESCFHGQPVLETGAHFTPKV